MPVDEHEGDRHENRGRDARPDESWITKNLQALLVAGGLGVFGGGGALGGASLAAKIDATNEKLDKLTLALTELRGQVTASEQGAVRHDAALAAITARVSALEQSQAANHEKLAEAERRLSKIEGK